ncbi:hypothetical protein TVAG_443560 [Trichomonas vaginalis G3]|uniref:DUF3447 domain-containing protein n=1 Tax=Trichomonas vaginalis (strain ATCC PRA-98 / G3) TaxID=412133 RepID=A2ETY0_TRIV3|nr:spectrin binding [Trichomonas vaginalis G3]EAY03868.1 hypothetical protein TVAG_443560 [Trichomonas vaginalis G3]KAI5552963.1 spectrin binding [Trichomonas vaginalis G3]|eukprot:XP_001316091.1 hypothetical protein [Trichomonas vaginalis G3]
MSLCKDYNDTFVSLYKLKTFQEEAIQGVYQAIKINIVESKILSPQQILELINIASNYNFCYIKSYLSIAKKIYDDYQPKQVKISSNRFKYLFYKEYGIIFEDTDLTLFKEYESKNYFSYVFDKNTIYNAIANDDVKQFISFSEIGENFDYSQKFLSEDDRGYDLVELCCLYASVNCFKFLRTKFNVSLTSECLQYSFLGGNPDIMSECLKNSRLQSDCMEYAIISHNIDFVTFLMNEYRLEIDLEMCARYQNLQAFLVFLDKTKNINLCFIYSPIFSIPSLCEYFISHGADVNIGRNTLAAIHMAAIYNCTLIIEFLFSHGADINIRDSNGYTPLHYTSHIDSKEAAELLISNGIDINAKSKQGETALHIAAQTNAINTAKILIAHGANINEKNDFGKAPLHLSSEKDYKEMVDFLITNGANINALDNDW